MKKITWVICVVASACMVQGALIEDSFETYTVGTNIGGNNGWTDQYTTASQGVTVAATNSALGTGSQAMHFVDNDATATLTNVRLWNVFTESLTSAVFTFDFMETTYTQTPLFSIRKGIATQAVALSLGSNIQYHNGTAFTTLTTGLTLGTWYEFKITTDVANDTFDLMISDADGVYFSATGLAFRNAVDDLDRMDFSTNAGNGFTGADYYIDDVSVSAVPEPASLGLLSFAGALILFFRRYGKK